MLLSMCKPDTNRASNCSQTNGAEIAIAVESDENLARLGGDSGFLSFRSEERQKIQGFVKVCTAAILSS
jgi:hypothetical protein